MVNAGRIASIRATLKHLEPLDEVDVLLPESGESLHIFQPADLDQLLNAVEHDPEQNLPYWAEIWSSGVALADEIVAEPELLRGRRVLEIGCGIGVTATAAVRAGAELTVTDYASAALALCGANCVVNVGRGPVAEVRFNWRRPDERFFETTGEGFPVVLAADVLYESRDLDPLLALVERVVAADGMLWLAEPGRQVAERFLQLARARGWAYDANRHYGPWPDPKDTGNIVRVYRMWRE